MFVFFKGVWFGDALTWTGKRGLVNNISNRVKAFYPVRHDKHMVNNLTRAKKIIWGLLACKSICPFSCSKTFEAKIMLIHS